MKTFITLMIFLLTLPACSKVTDYSYLNTDRRPYVVRISERYDNPPSIGANGFWLYHKIIIDTLNRDTRTDDYRNIPVDTIPKDWRKAWCSIDKIDSNFKIEIRKFIVH